MARVLYALTMSSFGSPESEHDNASHHLLEQHVITGSPEAASEPPSFAQHDGQQVDLQHPRIRRLLYISHFLSTWNSRAFEFGAFLFLATIYPQTLLPASIYALARASSAAILSPWLGGYIDCTTRLKLVRLSIVGQRVAVALSCGLLLAMTQLKSLRTSDVSSYSALAVLSLLACVEKVAAVVNTIAIERDWVVVIANDNEDSLRGIFDTL